MQNVLEEGSDFWCRFYITKCLYHCVHPIHANNCAEGLHFSAFHLCKYLWASIFITIILLLFLLFLLVLILGFDRTVYNVRENEGNVIKIIVEKKKSAIDGNITVLVHTLSPFPHQDNEALGMLMN